MEWDGTGWDGVGGARTDLYRWGRVGQSGMVWDRVGRVGTD